MNEVPLQHEISPENSGLSFHFPGKDLSMGDITDPSGFMPLHANLFSLYG
jgi:hypothetical protein